MEDRPVIQILAEKLMEKRGVEYSVAYQALRSHLRAVSPTDFLAEMVKVTNTGIFRYLWSCGLSMYQQEIASKRWKELTE